MKTRPIARHASLQPFSRDHHFGLLLCWKIRKGIAKRIEWFRIKKYTDWFYENYLIPHFEVEENYVYPILGMDHQLVKKALSDHRKIKKLFQEEKELENAISLLEERLDAHIRYEERVLFNEIQKLATEEQLRQIKLSHQQQKFIENEEDEFWN